MSFQYRKYFQAFGMASTTLFQPPNQVLADTCLNCQLREDGGLEKRQGFQTLSSGIGGYGIHNYNYIDADGEIVEEILINDTNLYRLVEGSLNITYSGSQSRAVAQVIVESGELKLKLYENGANVLDRSLGKGFDETSTETVNDTATAITAVSNFSATVTGTSTIPAAFLFITPELSIANGATEKLKFFYTEEVNKTVTTTFDGLQSSLNSGPATNVFSTKHNNLLILTDGKAPKVYDGQTVYKAGLPIPSAPQIEIDASGKLIGVYDYEITYQQIDNQGKLTESSFSGVSRATVSRGRVVLLLPTLAAGSGYNTNCAKINGNQSASPSSGLVTLTVHDYPHTLKAGDTAYFPNRHEDVNSFVEYEVDSVTSTTVVLKTEDEVTVNDLDIISNNLRINVYRTQFPSSTRQLIASVANDSFSGVIEYEDNPRFAIIVGDQSGTSEAGLVTLTTTDKTGDDTELEVGDIVLLPDDTTEVVVAAVNGTSLTLESNADIAVSDEDIIILTDSSFTNFSGTIYTPGPPPDADFCTSYRQNLILSKNLNWHWSDENTPSVNNSGLNFPAEFFISESEKITGLSVSGDNLVIFKKNEIDQYLASPTPDSLNISKRNISREIGAEGQRSITSILNRTYFLNRHGIYEIQDGGIRVDGTVSGPSQLTSSSGTPQDLSDPIKNFFRTKDQYIWNRSTIVADPIRFRILVTLARESETVYNYTTSERKTLVYDIPLGRWFIYDLDLSGGGTIFNDDLYFISRTFGASLLQRVNRIIDRKDSHAFNDHVDAIPWEYETKWDVFEDVGAGTTKSFEHLKIYSINKYEEDSEFSPTITAYVYHDFVDSLIHSQLTYTFPAKGEKWDLLRWNDKPYGSWASAHERKLFKQELSEAIKIRFENSESSTNVNFSGFVIKLVSKEK